MDRSVTPEISINVPSRYILYPVSSSPLSSFPLSELPDTISRIEEEIGNNTDEDRSDGEDGEMEIDNKIEDIHVYK